MLVAFTVALMLAAAYAFLREGLLTACCTFINVLLAGLVAFGFWEPLADRLETVLDDSFLAGYEDCFVLVGLFAVTLGALRFATNSLAFTTLDFPPALMQVGVVVFGILTGYLVAGFLVCAFHTLPSAEGFLELESKVEADKGGLRRLVPPDRVWLAMMHRAGVGPFSWGRGPTFDPNGNFVLRYGRYRRKDADDKVKKNDGALAPR